MTHTAGHVSGSVVMGRKSPRGPGPSPPTKFFNITRPYDIIFIHSFRYRDCIESKQFRLDPPRNKILATCPKCLRPIYGIRVAR